MEDGPTGVNDLPDELRGKLERWQEAITASKRLLDDRAFGQYHEIMARELEGVRLPKKEAAELQRAITFIAHRNQRGIDIPAGHEHLRKGRPTG